MARAFDSLGLAALSWPNLARGPLKKDSASASISEELLHQAPDVGEVEEFARSHHAHRLVLLPVKVTGSGVNSNNEISAYRQRTFQETIVGFMPDDVQVRQGLALAAAVDDFSNELGLVPTPPRIPRR